MGLEGHGSADGQATRVNRSAVAHRRHRCRPDVGASAATARHLCIPAMGARSWMLQERAVPRETVAWFVAAVVGLSYDVSLKAREQYVWAIGHIEAELGAVRLDRLDRADIARWLEAAAGGRPPVSAEHRSAAPSSRPRSPTLSTKVCSGATRRAVAMPRQVTKPPKVKATDAWARRRSRFLEMCADHRWAVGFRLAVLYGLRRSEVLGLRWDDVVWDSRTIRIDEGLVALDGGVDWTPGKTARSRRVIGLVPATLRLVTRRRRPSRGATAGQRWLG